MADPIVIYCALGLVIVISGFFIRNLLVRVEKYEDAVEEQAEFIAGLSDTIKQSQAHLKELDSKGAFQSDDETGYFFNQLKLVQEELDKFQVTETYGQSKKQS
jgi:cell division protein FtsB